MNKLLLIGAIFLAQEPSFYMQEIRNIERSGEATVNLNLDLDRYVIEASPIVFSIKELTDNENLDVELRIVPHNREHQYRMLYFMMGKIPLFNERCGEYLLERGCDYMSMTSCPLLDLNLYFSYRKSLLIEIGAIVDKEFPIILNREDDFEWPGLPIYLKFLGNGKTQVIRFEINQNEINTPNIMQYFERKKKTVVKQINLLREKHK